MSLEEYTKDRIDELIYDAIDTIRCKKHKIPDENSICCLLNANTENDKNIIFNRIKFLIENRKLRNKPSNGVNSYIRVYALDPESFNLSSISSKSFDSIFENKSSSSPSSKLQHKTPLPPENIQNTPFSSQTANKSSSPPLSELKDQKSFSSENTQNTQLPSEINIQLETPFISHSKSLTTPCSLKSLITCENEM